MENRRYSIAIKIIYSFLFFFSLALQAQGYAAYLNNLDSDPVANFYKEVRLLVKEGYWDEIEKKLSTPKVKKQLEDLKTLTKQDLFNEFKTVIQSKKEEELSPLLFRFYAETIQEKFYWNLQEKLQDLTVTTVRLTVSKTFFSNILAPRILEADRQSQETEAPTHDYETILKLFGECEIHLGSAGVFGLGAVPPDEKSFRRDALKIVDLLKKYYTFEEILLPEKPEESEK